MSSQAETRCVMSLAVGPREPTDEDLDDDQFEDAVEEQPSLELEVALDCGELSLVSSLEDARRAVTFFFNNQFDEAKAVLRPHAEDSLYHSLGTAVFAFMEATLTFQQDHVKTASDQLKNCVNVCDRMRRKVSITEALGKMVKRPNYNAYTSVEMHAELCYAEALLLKSLLTFIEDETLMTFLKAGLKIRSCFNSYKECNEILSYRDWDQDSQDDKVHFEGGVRMGMGTFNLMISLLPPRIIKLLEFIGFSGNKDFGLMELEKGFSLEHSLRQVLCVMSLLAYHLIVTCVLSRSDGDLLLCDRILEQQLLKYPKGVWFLFFKGRLEFMRGNLDEASSWYVRSWHSQDVWPHFHHMAFWELMFVNCIRMDWRQADEYAELLQQHSRWSRTIYSYQQAAILMMLSASPNENPKIEELMRNAPRWKQRIAGKSLPMEKFAVRKTERYFAQKKQLVLPALELVYVWNLFKVVGKKWTLAEGVFQLIERAERSFDDGYAQWATGEYAADNKALILLLKGALFAAMGSFEQGEKCLREVVALERKLCQDHYLVPYALIELANIAHRTGENQQALTLIDNVRKNYTGYSLEGRLHFQMHSLSMDVLEGRSRDMQDLDTEIHSVTHL